MHSFLRGESLIALHLEALIDFDTGLDLINKMIRRPKDSSKNLVVPFLPYVIGCCRLQPKQVS